MQIFGSDGEWIRKITEDPSPAKRWQLYDPVRVAIDHHGNIYVSDELKGVYGFSETGDNILFLPFDGVTKGIAIGPKGELIIAAQRQIHIYAPVSSN